MRWLLWLLALLLVAAVAVFAFVPGYLEGGMNLVMRPAQPVSVSERARALHETLPVADLHSDTFLWHRDPLKRAVRGHVDVPRLQSGGVALQVFAAVTKSPSGQNYESNDATSDTITGLVMVQRWPMATWSSLLKRALYQAERAERAAEANEFILIRDRDALTRFLASWSEAPAPRPVAGLMATEGAHPLEGELSNLPVLWEAGYRMLGLHHFFDNRLGGSLHGLAKGGLSDFGKAVVDAAEAQGFIIDVAHSSAASVADVLDRAERPVVVSHTGFAGYCDTPRNIPDQLMQRIAAAGGLIGVGYWDAAVCDITPAGIAGAIRYGIDLVGEDAVALGSDYDGATAVTFDTSELVLLTEALLAEGLTEAQIRKVMGGNQLSFLQTWLPPAPQ